MKPLHFNGEISATRMSVIKSIPVLPTVYRSSPMIGYDTRQRKVTPCVIRRTSRECIDALGGSNDNEAEDIEK